MSPPSIPSFLLTPLPSFRPPEDPFYPELFARKPESKMNFGLKKILSALKHYGDPHRDLPAILIAGTNGKGSTARFLERLLKGTGSSILTYLSPHIVHPRERFRIDGKEIEEDLLLIRLRELCHRHPDLSFFELLTLLAFLIARELQVGLGILEIGLGGRLDAVNVAEKVLGSVITSIGFDHREILGDTLSDIAREKGGILRRGVPLFTPPLPEEAEKIYLRMTEEHRSPWIRVIPPPAPRGIPEYLSQNAHLANRVAESLFQVPSLSLEELLPHRPLGRFTIVQLNPPKIIDGAHNPPGASALAKAIKELSLDGLHTFVRIGKSKEAKSIIEILSEVTGRFYFVQEKDPEWHDGRELSVFVPDRPKTIAPLRELLETFIGLSEPALFTGSLRGLKEPFLYLSHSLSQP
jgi:dihydrofolate synthase/folylpolyglutamate synthase